MAGSFCAAIAGRGQGRTTAGSARLAAVAVALVVLALQGCTGGAWPTVSTTPTTTQSRGQAPIVTVQSGDTLWGIAQKLGVPVRELIDANNLRPPYSLRVGQSLLVPRGRSYSVVSGDTVAGLSRRFGVPMNELVRLNRLRSPFTIYVGQTLRLPFSTMAPESDVPQTQLAATFNPPPVPMPRPPSQSQPSQSNGNTAQQPAIQQSSLPPVLGANSALRAPPSVTAPSTSPHDQIPSQPIRQTAVVDPGPVVQITPSASVAAVPPLPVGRPVVARAESPINTVSENTQAVVADERAGTDSVAGGRLPTIPPRANSSRFAWPVDGRVISSFGPKTEGLRNDGINIAAPRGTAIRAAENGVVVYASDGLKAFGNLLLIRHADGWVSAYAHAERLLVRRGDTVTRGQTVGTVGSTGDVTQPQLHFQLRRQDKPVDPNPLLT